MDNFVNIGHDRDFTHHYEELFLNLKQSSCLAPGLSFPGEQRWGIVGTLTE